MNRLEIHREAIRRDLYVVVWRDALAQIVEQMIGGIRDTRPDEPCGEQF